MRTPILTRSPAHFLALATAAALLVAACDDGDQTPADDTGQTDAATIDANADADASDVDLTADADADAIEPGWVWDLPSGFPEPRVPEDNAMSDEKVELGRHLFYDERLSGNGTQACATCHLQELAFTDALDVSVGSTGEMTPRNSPTLTNVAYNATLTWANPILIHLEEQIAIPMFGEGPIELGILGNEDEVIQRFRDDAAYQALFAAAFPDDAEPIEFLNIQRALASFSRTMISAGSPYDRYIAGDAEALSDSARRGLQLFFSERLECHHCHGGFNFTESTVHAGTTFDETPFHNTGIYNIDGLGAYPNNNTGLYEFTADREDMGKFRAPTLRNIALTAPYFHDGSAATLDDVVRHYERGGRLTTEGPYAGDGRDSPVKSTLVSGFTLTDEERTDLLAFLDSLTDETFVTDPRFASPFE